MCAHNRNTYYNTLNVLCLCILYISITHSILIIIVFVLIKNAISGISYKNLELDFNTYNIICRYMYRTGYYS